MSLDSFTASALPSSLVVVGGVGEGGGDKNSDRRVISAAIFFRTLSLFFAVAATELHSEFSDGRPPLPLASPSLDGGSGGGRGGATTRSDVEVAESFLARMDFFLSQRPRGGRGGAVGSGGN